MRQSLGTACFFGMLGVTVFGLLSHHLYTVVQSLSRRLPRAPAAALRAAPIVERITYNETVELPIISEMTTLAQSSSNIGCVRCGRATRPNVFALSDLERAMGRRKGGSLELVVVTSQHGNP